MIFRIEYLHQNHIKMVIPVLEMKMESQVESQVVDLWTPQNDSLANSDTLEFPSPAQLSSKP